LGYSGRRCASAQRTRPLTGRQAGRNRIIGVEIPNSMLLTANS